MNEYIIIYNNILALIKTRKYNIISKLPDKKTRPDDHLLIDTDKAIILYIINYETGIIKKGDAFIKKINDILKTYNNKKIIIFTRYKISSNLYKKIITIKNKILI